MRLVQGSRMKADDSDKKTDSSQVLLTIQGRQTDPDGNTQEMVSVYRGVQIVSGDGYEFRCRSLEDPEEEISLFLSRTLLELERSGPVRTRMIFDPSLPAVKCDYATPFGRIPMVIRTERIALLERGARKDRIHARVKYTLTMEPDYIHICSVTIKVQPA